MPFWRISGKILTFLQCGHKIHASDAHCIKIILTIIGAWPEKYILTVPALLDQADKIMLSQ